YHSSPVIPVSAFTTPKRTSQIDLSIRRLRSLANAWGIVSYNTAALGKLFPEHTTTTRPIGHHWLSSEGTQCMMGGVHTVGRAPLSSTQQVGGRCWEKNFALQRQG